MSFIELTKKKLCKMYGMSESALSNLLNKELYQELEKVGYRKHSQRIPPRVARRIFELYDYPLTENDLHEKQHI